MEKTYNTQFNQPFNIVVSGQTESGKSEFCLKLIKNAHAMISPPVDLIYYVYKEWQDKFKQIQGVSFFKGYDDSIISKENLKNRSLLLILDDQMTDIPSDSLQNIFLVGRHDKINPVFLSHNLYYPGLKCMRTISLNTKYNIIFKNPHDKSAVRVLASQMYPGKSKWFMEAFDHVTNGKWTYLLVDCKPDQEEEIRLRTRIWPGEDQITYIATVSNKKR